MPDDKASAMLLPAKCCPPAMVVTPICLYSRASSYSRGIVLVSPP